jgi:hypothetical protein
VPPAVARILSGAVSPMVRLVRGPAGTLIVASSTSVRVSIRLVPWAARPDDGRGGADGCDRGPVRGSGRAHEDGDSDVGGRRRRHDGRDTSAIARRQRRPNRAFRAPLSPCPPIDAIRRWNQPRPPRAPRNARIETCYGASRGGRPRPRGRVRRLCHRSSEHGRCWCASLTALSQTLTVRARTLPNALREGMT